MQGPARNEAHQLASQFITMIRRGDTSLIKLKELRNMADAQLARYEKALNFLKQRDPEDWTYDQAEEVMRIGSGKADQVISRGDWDRMLRLHQLELRSDYVDMLEEGQAAFTEVKQEILREIGRKEQAEEGRHGQKQRWVDIQTKRKPGGLCVICGKPLSFFSRLSGKDRHSSCHTSNE